MQITKGWIVFGFWAIAVILFLIVGLDINSLQEAGLDYIGLGLASLTIGFIADKFINLGAE